MDSNVFLLHIILQKNLLVVFLQNLLRQIITKQSHVRKVAEHVKSIWSYYKEL